MTRWLLASAVAVLGTRADAVDYRDCKELFVAPLTAEIPERKQNGNVWDEGSPIDPEFRAKPKERGDIGFKVVGPKQQDTPKPAWNPLLVGPGAVGAWLPMRIGDVLGVLLMDRDAFSDDLVANPEFVVPKSLGATGVVFLMGVDRGVAVGLRVSVTDGKRTCAGLEQEPVLRYELPPMVQAQPDEQAFAVIAKHNRCNVNQASPACRLGSYKAVYADLNEDGAPDTVVAGGPFGAGGSGVVYFGLGFQPDARKQIFVGDCDKTGTLKKERAFTCTSDGVTKLVPLDGSAVRDATAKEQAEAATSQAEARASEARTTLQAMHLAQRSYFAEKDQYSTNAAEIGFVPGPGNRYAYFLAARGAVERRDGVSPKPLAPVIIGPDETKHKDALLPSGLKEAGCPLTFGTNADGEPVGLGVTGAGPDQQFIGYALGNVDDDGDFDCWSIATFERKAKDGRAIPAGKPFHERSDYEESAKSGGTGAASQALIASEGEQSPGVVAIRERYREVGSTQRKMTKVEKSIFGMSAEGSQLVGYFVKGELRKAEWTFYGEGGQFVSEMMFRDGQPEFVFEQTRSGGTGGPRWDAGETRYYLNGSKVIWATRGAERTPITATESGKALSALLETALNAKNALSTSGAKLFFENGKFVLFTP